MAPTTGALTTEEKTELRTLRREGGCCRGARDPKKSGGLLPKENT